MSFKKNFECTNVKKEIGEHSITLTTDRPVAFSPRRYTFWEEEFIEKTVNEMLQKGIIRKSKSLFRAPPVVVKKDDSKFRFCNDFRLLNKFTVPESYPLPLIEDIFDAMAGAKIFSKLDAESGYHQIWLKEEDKAKTAFSCKLGVFEYERMPFGVVNGPSTFQKIMDTILREYLWKFVVVYLDDVIILSKEKTEHEKHVKLVKDKLAGAGLKMNLNKCRFNEDKIEVLGHIITTKGILPLKSRAETQKNFRSPENLKELQSFLGLINLSSIYKIIY